MKTKFSIFLMFFAVLMFSACTTVNQKGSVGQSQAYYIHYGTISSIQEVTVENDGEQAVGGIIGGISGAALGSTIGSGSGRVIATALGTALGAVAGSYAGKQINGKALEIIVDTDNGQTLSVVERPDIQLHVGQRVRVMLGNNFSRVEPI